jgi:pyruvate/2-oxoglutarate/acetoin dehydrogenase E1 component
LIKSFKKTKKVLVLDPTWKSYGASAEIISVLQKSIKGDKKFTLDRISYPDSHTPMSQVLEKKFYIDKNLIIRKIKNMLGKI